MKIIAIKLEHTNPSLGPNEKIKTITLLVNSQTEKRVEEFLAQATINGVLGMKQFLEAFRSKNTDTLKKVQDAGGDRPLNEGESISNLTFSFEDGKSVKIRDVYRRFSISHFYPDFTAYMLENGGMGEYNSTLRKRDEFKENDNSSS